MKKELKFSFIFLFLVLSLFSLSFVSSLKNGECEVVPRTSCNESVGYIVMGLTYYTNAHGENSTSGSYSYVLCCARGLGNTSCDYSAGSNPKNKLLGLSSTTNAHGEISSNTNYLVPVCYEDFDCKNFIGGCDNPNYNLGVLSLSSTTNAHIGNFSEYSTKICCHTKAPKMCYLNKANWSVTKTAEGNKVKMQIYGDDPFGCNDLVLNLSVYEKDGDVKDYNGFLQPQTTLIRFGSDGVAYGEWTAQWVYDGLLEGNPEFGFGAYLVVKPSIKISSSNELEVTKGDICKTGIQVCGDYKDKTSCESDLCNASVNELSQQGISCEGTIDCNCYWNSSSNSCYGAYEELNTPGDPTNGCGKGYTLCKNSTGQLVCILGNACNPPLSTPLGNNNGICELNEGCTSTDCASGGTDTCESGLFCVNGRCWSYETTTPSCTLTSEIIKDCDEEPVGFLSVKVKNSCDAENPDGTIKQVLCPTEAALPFYGILAAALTLIVLAIIYYYIIKKRKKQKSNKTKKKKESKKKSKRR